jgi:hypothetical protein
MSNNFKRGLDPKDAMDIGMNHQLKEDVMIWLKSYNIQFKEDDFRYLKDAKNNILAIEVPVDRDKMLDKYIDPENDKEKKNIPAFVKEGEVFITFKIRR